MLESRFLQKFQKFADFILLHFELMQIKFHSGELFGNTIPNWVTRCQPLLKNPERVRLLSKRR